MENPVAQAIADIYGQATRAHHGADRHAALLKINKPEDILRDYNTTTTAQGEYKSADGALPELNKAVQKAYAEGYEWGQSAKDALKKHCGRSFSQRWSGTGFTSLAVPRDQDGIRTLLVSLSGHLKKNPQRENAEMGVTMAEADRLLQAIDDANKDVSNQESVIAVKKGKRDDAVKDMQRRLRGLIGELEQGIGTSDLRWRDFGFNVPDEPETPGQPVNVTVNNATPGQLLIQCDGLPFGVRFRFWKQGAGSPLPPVAAGTSAEPMFVLENLPGGEEFNLWVSAVNAAGREGVRSLVVKAKVLAATVSAVA